MSRSWTEEHVIKQLQQHLMTHFDETNMTPEEFAEQTDMWPEVFTRFQHARDRGEVMSPRSVYAIWDALNLPKPKVTIYDVS